MTTQTQWNAETVYAISRWSEVFETAESRRHRQLQWIAHPVSFNSTGFQDLLDRFEPVMAAALYGCWSALVKIAATAPRRGVLAGQKGEPYSTARMARLSGFDADLFEKLVRWCCEIGWLVPAQADTGLPDITRQDITRPDRTGPDRTEPDARDPGRSGPAEGEKSFQEESRMPGTRPSKRSFQHLLRHPILEDLVDAEIRPDPDKYTGSVFNGNIVKPRFLEMTGPECDAYWLTWYRRQHRSEQEVLSAGTLAEAAIVLASVYAIRTLPGVRNRAALWIIWIKSGNGSQITDEDLQRASEVVRAVRARKAG